MGINRIDLCKDCICKTASEAIEKLYNYSGRVIIYNSDHSKLMKEIQSVYREIQRRNALTENINHQMIPTNPYFWDDNYEGLGIKCAEICTDGAHASVFVGLNYNVLVE